MDFKSVMQEVSAGAALLVEPIALALKNGILEAINSIDDLKRKGFQRSFEFSFEKFKVRLKNYYKSL